MKNCLVVIVCGAKSINNFDEQNGCTSCDKKVLTRTRGALPAWRGLNSAKLFVINTK